MNATIILAARREAQESFDSRTLSGKVWQLCDDHFAQVAQWLWQKETLESVELRCTAELGLPETKAPSKSGLGRFWRPSEPELRGFFQLLKRHNRQAMRASASEIAAEVKLSPSEYTEANIELIQQTTYELLEEGADAETVKPFVIATLKLRDMALKKEKLALDTRKLELLERQQAALKDTLTNKDLTPAERERKQLEIFGMA